MKKIESITLEAAYSDAAKSFACSITELHIEVIQAPTKGFFGLFKKSAIIVAAKKETQEKETQEKVTPKVKKTVPPAEPKKEVSQSRVLNDTIMPASFINDQDEDDEIGDALEFTADYDDAFDETHDESQEDVLALQNIEKIAVEVQEEINDLFDKICFKIDAIVVKAHDKETLLIEFTGEDSALLIGKEGYRYKALSYMIFNWINSKYEIQLRLEIAEFLQNQEESVSRYLVNVCENINRDGRAQTKILDGVLVQIALKELREKYPDKYVVIRSTKDGLKYIIVNDYHTN